MQYSGSKVILTVNPNGGTYNGSTKVVEMIMTAGQSITISVPQKDGANGIWVVDSGDAIISPEGITTQNEDEGVDQKPEAITEQTITMGNENAIIVARWTNLYYELTFDMNLGTETPITITKWALGGTTVETPTGEETTEGTKTGYTLVGWSEDPNASIEDFYISAEEAENLDEEYKYYIPAGGKYIMPYQNSTLTAMWKANEYTVTFDTQGGTLGEGEGTKTVTFDDTYGTLPTPIREGYTFNGWYTNSGTQITENTIVSTASDHTLYATWEVAPTITYNVNGGYWPDGTTDDKIEIVTLGETITITSSAPKKDGREVFIGWSTNSSATSAEYEPGGMITIYEDTILYAVYVEATVESITLSLSDNQWISYKGGTVNVSATVTMSNPNAPTPEITWTISTTENVDLSSSTSTSGETITVTGKDPGKTELTASAGGVTSNILKIYCYNVYLDGTYSVYYTDSSNPGSYWKKCGEKIYIEEGYYVCSWYYSGYYMPVSYNGLSYYKHENRYYTSTSCSLSSHTYKYVYQDSLP